MATPLLSDDQVPVALTPAPAVSGQTPTLSSGPALLADDQVPPVASAPTYPRPNDLQAMASPIVKGLSQIPGAPGSLLSLATGGRVQVGMPSYYEGLARSAGIVPADPNYQADTGLGRVLNRGTEALTSAAAPIGVGAEAAQAASPVLQGIGRLFSTAPSLQGASALAAGTAEQGAQEGGASPTGQALTGLTAGLLVPAGALGVGAAARRLAATPRAQALGTLLATGDQGAASQVGGNVIAARQAQTAANADPLSGVSGAVQNLESARALTTSTYAPTSGTLSNNSGLLQLEKGAAAQSPALQARQIQNQSARSQAVDAVNTPTGVAPQEATQAFQQNVNQRGAAADLDVSRAQDNLTALQNTPTDDQNLLSAMAGSGVRADAGVAAKKAWDAREQEADAIRSQLYAPLKDDPTPISLDQTLQTVRGIQGGQGLIPGTVPGAVTGLQNSLQGSPQAGVGILSSLAANGGTVQPFSRVAETLKQLNGAIDQAYHGGDTYGASQLLQVKRAMQGDLDAAVGTSSNTDLKAANQFNATVYAPKFQEGSGAALQSGRIPASQTIDKTLSGMNGDGAAEAAQRFAGALQDSPEGLAAVRTHFLNDLATKAGTAPSADSVTKYLQQNESVLRAFPDVQGEIAQIGERAGQKAVKVVQAQQGVDAATATAADTKKTIADSPEGQFAAADHPVTAVDQILTPGNQNAGQQMRQLMATASQDKTGRALEGLRNAVKVAVNTRMRNNGAILSTDNAVGVETGDLATSLAKQTALLKKGTPGAPNPIRDALEAVYTPEEMGAMDQAHKQLEVEARLSRKTTAGSDTAEKQTAIQMLTNSALGKVVGSAAQGATKAVVGIASLLPNVVTGDIRAASQKALQDALLDPAKMKALLLRPTAANLPTIRQALGASTQALVPRAVTAAAIAGPQQSNTAVATPASSPIPATPAAKPQAGVNIEANKPIKDNKMADPVFRGEKDYDQVVQGILDHEGPNTVQDGRPEIYGFRQGEPGFEPLRQAAQQFGPQSSQVRALAGQFLKQNASLAGADQFQDPGLKAAVTSITHLRGPGGARAILNAAAGLPLSQTASQIDPQAAKGLQGIAPSEAQQRLLTARQAYDNAFYANRPSTVQTAQGTQSGRWGDLYGKGLSSRYQQEAQQYLALSQSTPQLAATR